VPLFNKSFSDESITPSLRWSFTRLRFGRSAAVLTAVTASWAVSTAEAAIVNVPQLFATVEASVVASVTRANKAASKLIPKSADDVAADVTSLSFVALSNKSSAVGAVIASDGGG
jgi:F420-0:gamma-glutamyl ligase